MTISTKRRLGTRLGRRRLPLPQGRGTLTTTGTGSGSGGGVVGGAGATAAFQLSPWTPTSGQPFDVKMAGHLMRRAGFGASPEQLQAMVQIGVHRTVDLLTIPSTNGLQEFGSQMLPTGELLNLGYNLSHQRAQWIHEAATTDYPLKEKMALFFHDHFSVGANGSITVPLLLPHVNIFRRHGLGNFRDILIEVSRDPAMLYWLDNRINGAGNPPRVNENYGREILELYSMGEGSGYTQDDVLQASKCLAGWSLSYYNKYRYNTSYARAGAGLKWVLGRFIYIPSNQEQEGFALIETVLAQKASSEYLVGKIWSYFVAERPADTDPVEQKLWDEVVVELAARWKAVSYDLRALMSTILRSNYFFSSRAIGRLIKNPMEYVVGVMRNMGTPFIGRYATLGFRIEQMGLPLFRYGNPSGLDDGAAWIDSQAIINRANYANDFTQVSRTADFRINWNPLTVLSKYKLSKSQEIVDHFLGALVDGDVPTVVRTNLLEFMDYYDGTPRIYRPYDQLAANSQYRITKVRGLLQLILTLPEYTVN